VTGVPLNFVTLTSEQLAAGLAQAGLPDFMVDTVLSIQQGFARGSFDIISGDVDRLAGRPTKSVKRAR